MADTRSEEPVQKHGSGRTLWVHIGGIKTGTATLQRFLSCNRKSLAKKGFLYPGSGESHHGIATELMSPHTADSSGIAPRLSGLMEEIARSSLPSCIISAEDLSGLGGAAALRALIPGTLSVKVIYYVRRQDELVESWYNQVIKTAPYQVSWKLDRDRIEEHAFQFDHEAVIRPWAACFGKENVTIRCYENGQLHGDIIQDFCRVVGLVPDAGFVVSEERRNQRFSLDCLEFLRLCKAYYPEERDLHRFLRGELQKSRTNRQVKRRYLLSPGERRALLERYEESNRRIAQDYLDRKDGRLFYDPWPDPEEPWEPYRGLTAETLVPIATELIFAQARRERAGQPLQTILVILNNLLKKVPVLARSRNPPVPGQPGSMTAFCRDNSGVAEGTPPEPPSIEALAPGIAMTIYRRHLLLVERKPLATAFVMINHLLIRAVARIPHRKRQRIGRRMAGGGPGDG